MRECARARARVCGCLVACSASKGLVQDNLGSELPQLQHNGMPDNNGRHNNCWWWRTGVEDTGASGPRLAARRAQAASGIPPLAVAQGSGEPERRDGHLLANMAEALKNQASTVHELAGSNPCGVYVEAEQQPAQRRHPACYVALPGRRREPHMQAAEAVLATAHGPAADKHKPIEVGGKPYVTKTCPLCGEAEETQGHVLLACKALEGTRMERHHRAGRLKLEATRTGARGGDIVCADLGSAATCQEEGTQC